MDSCKLGPGCGLLILLAAPELAHGHASIPGAEGFVRGIVQPLQEPAQGLLAASSGVLVGRAEARRMAVLWFGYCFSAVLGACLFGLASGGVDSLSLTVVLCALLITGLSLTSCRQAPPMLAYAVVASGGLVCGMNALSSGTAGQFETTSGGLAGSALLSLYLAAGTHWLRRREHALRWLQLLPRIAGAWASAIAVLGLAFAIRAVP